MFCWYPLVRYFKAFSNRSGVFRNPSRFGSSPSITITLRIKSAMLSFGTCKLVSCSSISVGLVMALSLLSDCLAVCRMLPGILKRIVRGFFNAHPLESRPGEVFQPLVYLDANVFRRGHFFAKRRDFFVERMVIKRLDNLPQNESIQVRQIHDHARGRIHHP